MNLQKLNKKKILVFSATYNEAENISEFINSIINHNSNVEVLIIDDNSPDNTSHLIEDLKKNFIKLI